MVPNVDSVLERDMRTPALDRLSNELRVGWVLSVADEGFYRFPPRPTRSLRSLLERQYTHPGSLESTRNVLSVSTNSSPKPHLQATTDTDSNCRDVIHP